MATKSIEPNEMKEFLEEILKCPNCKCQIKDPRILPCYHSFCLNCLRQHIENGLQNCASCQEKVPLPVNNVWGFPKNDVLHKILNFINPSNVSSSGGEGYALNNQILGNDNDNQLNGGSKNSSKTETKNIAKPDKEIIYKNLEEILKESLVPHLTAIYSCPYYYGDMSRLEAESLLQNKPNGSFLLRNSSDKKRFPYSITFKQNEEIWSMRIEFYINQFRFEDQESWMPCFESAMDLIEHYQKIPNPTLLQPVLRKDPFSLKELSKAVVSDSTTFGDVNELPIPRELHKYLRLQKLTM